MFHCSTIICCTVPPSLFHLCPVPNLEQLWVGKKYRIKYFKLKGFDISFKRDRIVLLHHDCSTVPPLDVVLFHPQVFHCLTIRWSSVSPSNIPLFQYEIFYLLIISVLLFNFHTFYCSTIRCSTVPPSNIPLFQHEQFCLLIISLSLFHHQMFFCSTMIVSLLQN